MSSLYFRHRCIHCCEASMRGFNSQVAPLPSLYLWPLFSRCTWWRSLSCIFPSSTHSCSRQKLTKSLSWPTWISQLGSDYLIGGRFWIGFLIIFVSSRTPRLFTIRYSYLEELFRKMSHLSILSGLNMVDTSEGTMVMRSSSDNVLQG